MRPRRTRKRRELKPKRKYIRWTTKAAAFALRTGDITYDVAKTMTEKQFLACWEWDHNIPHASGGDDSFLNITPLLKERHRAKTKRDVKDMAKTRRIRRDESKWLFFMPLARPVKKKSLPHWPAKKRRWPKRSFQKRVK